MRCRSNNIYTTAAALLFICGMVPGLHPGLLAQPHQAAGHHQQGESEGILFLQFTVTGSATNLTEATVVPGRLKTPRIPVTPGRAYHIELVDAAGQILGAASEDDPLLQRYCYVDDSGALATHIERVQEAVIMIRLPWKAEADRVRLIRTAPPRNAKQPPVVLSVTEFRLDDITGGRP
jgi:hypothetical protein